MYGIWPINLDCAGVTVTYATAQPICSLAADGQSWFFFTAIDGIRPDFVVSDGGRQTRVQNITPDTGVAFTRQSSHGRKVNFIVLTVEQGRQLWKMPLAGRKRVVLSPDAILPDSDGRIRFETCGAAVPAAKAGETPAPQVIRGQPLSFAVFPPLASVAFSGTQATPAPDGVFQRFTAAAVPSAPAAARVTAVRPAEVTGERSPSAIVEESWKTAAVWRLDVLHDARDRKLLLRIHYVGDVARVYAGGKLMVDNFYNGQPFDLASWRIPRQASGAVEIRILPLRKDRVAILPENARPTFSSSSAIADVVKVEPLELTQTVVTLNRDVTSP